MSSEQFDKHIKKKLESVRPSYNQAAWNNFRKLLPQPWYVAFYQAYKGWLYSTVGTVAIVTTSYLFYQEKKENEQLHDKITTLTAQVAQSKTNQNNQVALEQPDTFGINGRIVPPVPASPEEPKDAATNQLSDQNRPEKQPNLAKPEPGLNSFAKNNTENRTTLNRPTDAPVVDNPGINNKVSLSPAKPNIVTQTPAPTNQNTEGTTVKEKITHNQITSGEENLPPAANPSNPIIQNGNATDVPQKPAIPDNSLPLATTKTNKAATDSVATSETPEPTASTTAPQKTAWDLTHIKARFGIGSDVSGKQKFTLGPIVEVFLTSRISLNTGLLFSAPQETRLPQPHDYNNATGKRFEDVYHPHIPRNDRIRDIKLRTSIIKLPIAFYYYFPTNKAISFMAMAGTKLDLSVYESVEFRSSFQGEERLNRFENRPTARTFNGLFYGAGLQYQYGRFIGQVAPYFNLYFRDQNYFNHPGRFGLNATLKFDLKK